MMLLVVALSLFITYPLTVNSVCPFLLEGTPPTNNATVPDTAEYDEAVSELDIVAVFDDLFALLSDSQECWPADTFYGEENYGPLFIRLAWHCAGTFRITDGLGGCGGGRQRFWPEASWDDNTNLDKARAILYPIKETYGDALSWGDLFIFAGTAAILDMGGPVTEVCAGRVDSANGSLSDPLNEPCGDQGNCGEPWGSSTVGLIYVNPEGVEGNPIPSLSAARIREIFGRMGMNDSETVALIGGGHAFGKSHGACPAGAGPPPNEQPLDPWPGLCGTGIGEDTFTSGIEGQWTEFPFRWDNDYFTYLVEDSYTLHRGAGNKSQWMNDRNGYLMMTTDLALVNDDEYLEIVTDFANDIELLDIAFSAAWEKLTTSGGIWSDSRQCIDARMIMNTTTLPTTTHDHDHSTTTTASADASTVATTDEKWRAFGYTVLAGLAVLIGTCCVFCIKPTQVRSVIPVALGFAAGVLLHIALMHLYTHALEEFIYALGGDAGHHHGHDEHDHDSHDDHDHDHRRRRLADSDLEENEIEGLAHIFTLICCIVGVFLMIAYNRLIKIFGHGHIGHGGHDEFNDNGSVILSELNGNSKNSKKSSNDDEPKEQPLMTTTGKKESENSGLIEGARKGTNGSDFRRISYQIAIATILHHFPEGIATYVALVYELEFGVLVAFALALHDIPCGIAMASTIYCSTGSYVKPFILAGLAALAYPIGAFVGWLIVQNDDDSETVNGILFGIVAGIMIYLVLIEIIPEMITKTIRLRDENITKYSYIAMMIGLLFMEIFVIIMAFADFHSH